MTMVIKIKGTDYNFKINIRGMMIFEEVRKKTFELTNLTDTYVYMYCILTACNDNFVMTFDEFLDELDENPTLVLQMTNIIFSDKEKKN